MDYILCGTPIPRRPGKPKEKRPECILGVCDPIRAFLKPEARHAEPLILGSLVQHMFFWLIDHNEPLPAGEHSRVPRMFERIITAPKHMTSYTIASYFLKKECLIGEDTIPGHLYPISVPGLEAEAFRYFQTFKHTRNYTYLTLDTEDVFNVKPDERVILDFDTFSDVPRLRDVGPYREQEAIQ